MTAMAINLDFVLNVIFKIFFGQQYRNQTFTKMSQMEKAKICSV